MGSPRPRLRRWLGLLAPAACGACAIISVEDYVGRGSADDAGPSGDAPTGASDAAPGPDAAPSASPVVIASNVVPSATGGSQQTHLFYSKDDGRWVLFGFDGAGTGRLVTRLSTDFVTWTDGASLTLPRPHSRDGRNLAVTALPTSSRAFHLALSLAGDGHSNHHVRARLQGDVSFEKVTLLGGSGEGQDGMNPDGPAVTVNPAGRVFVLAGWTTPPDGGYGVSNVIPWISRAVDTGSTWTPDFSAPLQLETVKLACNARALVPTSEGALAVWESADEEPSPHTLRAASYGSAGWGAIDDVGFRYASFDADDWGVATLGTRIHVVRRADVFAHRVWTNGKFEDGATMPAVDHRAGSGVVLLPDGASLRAYAIAASGAIMASTYADNWSDWTEVVPGGPSRMRLTGTSSNGVAALAWVEEASGSLSVVGYRLR